MGDGTTEYVHIMRSGYSSRILEMRRVPIPAPVPPPSEWVIWKPIHHVIECFNFPSGHFNEAATYPASSSSLQLPCGQHRAQSRRAQLPRCNLKHKHFSTCIVQGLGLGVPVNWGGDSRYQRATSLNHASNAFQTQASTIHHPANDTPHDRI